MIIHHVSIGSDDVARAGRFYDAVLGVLGYRRVSDYAPHAIGYGEEPNQAEFWVGRPHDGALASPGNGVHIAFDAPDKAALHRFYELALSEGGQDAGTPGPRPEYGPDYYGAFVRDLDGNKIEAVLRPFAAPAMSLKPATKKAKKAKKAKKVAKKAAKKIAKKTLPGRKLAKKVGLRGAGAARKALKRLVKKTRR